MHVSKIRGKSATAGLDKHQENVLLFLIVWLELPCEQRPQLFKERIILSSG